MRNSPCLYAHFSRHNLPIVLIQPETGQKCENQVISRKFENKIIILHSSSYYSSYVEHICVVKSLL